VPATSNVRDWDAVVGEVRTSVLDSRDTSEWLQQACTILRKAFMKISLGSAFACWDSMTVVDCTDCTQRPTDSESNLL